MAFMCRMSDIPARQPPQPLSNRIDPAELAQAVAAWQAQQPAQPSQQQSSDAAQTPAAVFKATWSEEEKKKCLAGLNLMEVQRKREAVKNPSKKGGHVPSANVISTCYGNSLANEAL